MVSELIKNPLFLPKGSVRAILALGTVGAAAYFMSRGTLSFENFMTMTAVVYAFYFGSKKASESSVVEVKKEEVCDD